MSERDSGSILEGKYEILERLATGGMGEVYRARHVHLHETRVIKILRQDRAADPTAIQRFTQEARIATQIKHANVAILYDFSRLPDGSFFMVWENIEGEDVGSWLRSKGPFPLDLAVEVGIQALRGLDAIHSAGVIHRDISPDNLMITRDRRGKVQVKIIDLGLAKNLDTSNRLEITQAGMFMGKLMYCSPEQAGSVKDAPLDHRSDLYSFAAVLYEMITGKPPFDSESQHGFIFKRLTEPPLSMIGRNPDVKVPRELDAIVLKSLEKDRDRRYPDALSFLRALVQISDQLRAVATQEVQIPRPEGAPARIPGAPTPRPPSAELSREERIDLLAQIDRAAKKVGESQRLAELAAQAIQAGRVGDAESAIAELESMNPRSSALPQLKQRLVEAGGRAPAATSAAPRPAPRPQAQPAATAPVLPVPPAARPTAAAETPRPSQAVPPARSSPPPPPPPPPRPALTEEQKKQIAETEALVEKYLLDQKQSLARLALDNLIEIAPDHRKRADYENAVRTLGQDAGLVRRIQKFLEEARAAVARDDLRQARIRLEAAQRMDSFHLTEGFAQELAAIERDRAAQDELEKHRGRMEELLESRRFKEAGEELQRLSDAGLAKVSLESYRLRVADLSAMAEREAKSQEYEKRYRERIGAKDWMGARDLVIEYEKAVPESPRPAQLFGEVSRLEEVQRRQQGIEQGLKQIESFIRDRRPAEAEMALRIVLQMDPEHPQRAQLEERVRSLRQR